MLISQVYLIQKSMLFPHNKEPATMEKIVHAAIITFLLHLLTLITPPSKMGYLTTSVAKDMTSIASFFDQYFD